MGPGEQRFVHRVKRGVLPPREPQLPQALVWPIGHRVERRQVEAGDVVQRASRRGDLERGQVHLLGLCVALVGGEEGPVARQRVDEPGVVPQVLSPHRLGFVGAPLLGEEPGVAVAVLQPQRLRGRLTQHEVLGAGPGAVAFEDHRAGDRQPDADRKHDVGGALHAPGDPGDGAGDPQARRVVEALSEDRPDGQRDVRHQEAEPEQAGGSDEQQRVAAAPQDPEPEQADERRQAEQEAVVRR